MTELRWKQRFQNFERAFLLLRDAMENNINELSELEKEGIIQRFEYTFELAWKTLKDYLNYTGITLEQVTPRYVIKAAFAAKIINNGQAWIDMLTDRNLMSHTYNEVDFERVVLCISNNYLNLFDQLFMLLKEKNLGK